MKTLLNVDQLIEHMKTKGIMFNEVSEEDAKIFLSQHNYYMKLASYRANYKKHMFGERKGQYINLDFGYLKELSTIDMHLRYIIIEMCLDLEHAIKVKLLNDIEKNSEEDGYNIVKKYIAEDSHVLNRISRHKAGEYCKDLIKKYYPDFPIWVFVELISFGSLLHLCDTYKKEYNKAIVNNNLMNVIRDLRNAAAHSNCVINKMTEKIDAQKQPHIVVTQFISNMKNISKDSRRNNLKYKFTYSFITLLCVYDNLMPEVVKIKRYGQLKDFMEGRVIRHKEYFEKHTQITSIYEFHKKVIDNLAN